ncbi:hypothetical protein BOTNAR_0467g00040 [Botryotinia narcissicola]|uniref:Uncharacterized protein n=1 Tax=Botryotinia narcissicola TaxID=278944 RepID=A0A4Z1HUF6_9HELO|nr:hypothetical protein BOTNAR_0467g00040 [Botryotinia narcissicola]
MDIEVVQENADGYCLDPELADISENRTFYLPNSSIILHMVQTIGRVYWMLCTEKVYFRRPQSTLARLEVESRPVEFRQRARVGFERRVENDELINTGTGKVTYLEHICLAFSMRLEPEV